MKKLFILPVLFFLVLTSCKEEQKVSPQSVSEQIKGSWVTVSQHYRYYDEEGQLVHEHAEADGTAYLFDEFMVTTTYRTGTTTQCFYTVFGNNGKDYIQLTVNGRSQELEITSFTPSGMSWQGRLENTVYSAGSTTTAEAAYAIVTVGITRQ